MSRVLLKKVLQLPRRIEPLGGQNYSYVCLEDVTGLIEAELEKPEHDPVCFANKKDLSTVAEKIGSGGFIAQSTHLTNTGVNGNIPLYTNPPAQQAPMSVDEIIEIGRQTRSVENNDFLPVLFARSIEKAHGIG